MTRKEFIKICGLFGISLPFYSALISCKKDDEVLQQFSGKVVIIGAGAGGLSAGYFLQQQSTDFEIIEATPVHGGRMKIDTRFSDFPIPLGAEWLETNAEILQEIVNDDNVTVDIATVDDDPDLKFVNSSWFSFFEEYIVPSIAHKISYNTVVQSIDYSGNQVVVTTNRGQISADKVVVSVPLQVLKDGDISFTPSLPQSKLNAIRQSNVWAGFKAFFEFNTLFYDDEHEFLIEPTTNGQKIYYNASKGQNSSKNILGLFVVGTPALDYISRSDDDLKTFILEELDSIYAQNASPNYIKHITQNWNGEPFIKGGYLSDHEDWKNVKELGKSVASKVYFAGSEFTDGEDWVSVHTAVQAAKTAVTEINL